MLLRELYEYYGTWTSLCRELGMGNNSYQRWKKQGYIPFQTQLLIEHKTKRRFKAREEDAQPILES